MQKAVFFTGLFLVFCCGTGVIVADEDRSKDLFRGAGQIQPRDTVKSMEPTVIRSRPVYVDFALLKSLRLKHVNTFRFNLFDDLFFDAVAEKINERSPNSYTCFGRLTGDDFGNFGLAVEKDVMIADITPIDGRLYQVRFLGSLEHEVREVDESMFPECGTGPEQVVQQQDLDTNLERDAVQTHADDGSVFDVMVVYTPEARQAQGGATAMTALINLAVDQANIAYENSQMAPILQLVYEGEIDYVESGDGGTDLGRLRGTSDGYMDAVHDLRDQCGADMVSLMVDGLNYCGIGYLMTTLSSGFESWAFTVVGTSCVGNHTFAHELGHNMGSHHAVGDGDPGTVRGSALYPYSHGWRWVGDDQIQYRSVMAYSPGTRIPHFSNPNVSFAGKPTGRPDLEDNARSIDNAAYTVANWRQSVFGILPPDFSEDGKVAFEDYSTLAQYWRHAESSVDIAPPPSGDGIVDYKDLATLAQYWLRTTPPRWASNPNPTNGATGVSAVADLSWTAGRYTTSHDVYFGKSSPPPFIRNQTATTFDPGTMASSTKYYWQIDEVNAGGKTTGRVWSFTTGGPPP